MPPKHILMGVFHDIEEFKLVSTFYDMQKLGITEGSWEIEYNYDNFKINHIHNPPMPFDGWLDEEEYNVYKCMEALFYKNPFSFLLR